MRNGVQREIVHRPNRQRHQADKEKHGETEDAVNHFFLGYQVHEITGDEKRFATGDQQRDRDVNFAARKMDVGSPYRKYGAEDERDKNIQVTPYMMGEMIGMLRMCLVAHKSQ
jgi:hypothetical protein